MPVFDHTIQGLLRDRLEQLEAKFDADVAFYFGAIDIGYLKVFRDFIEELKQADPQKARLVLMVNTNGGSAEASEKMVEIMRHHYDEVYFVVPDFAMSAGTILCMAGDKIYMDYSSSLGPIDPQVYNGSEWVPALGYIDQVERMLEKSKNGDLTPAEFIVLQNLDLAALNQYEQARNLTVTLLKKWLVEYKFKSWDKHSSTGAGVTQEEKEARADEIARNLGDNKLWHSHGRFIGVETLQNFLKLKIEDYSDDKELLGLIRGYNDLIREYILRSGVNFFLHSTHFA